jgi:hypothetical protein
MRATPSSTKPRRRRLAAALAAAGLVGLSLYGLGPGGAIASSHREAPLIAGDPACDNTDVYAFVAPERPQFVNFVVNFAPFSEPNGGPNFYPFDPNCRYNVNVDNNGDAKADAVFRWSFKTTDNRGNNTFLYNNGPVTTLDDENLLFRQSYTLESSFNNQPFKTRITNAPVAPSRVGPASMPNYQALRDAAVVDIAPGNPNSWKGFAGQADDPFFLDLRVFDLLYGGDLSEVGQDTLAGFNVNTIALQVPYTDVALGGDATRNPVIGVWSTTERRQVRMADGTSSGNWVQISRLGQPLVNEVVVPTGLKDAFNSISPDKDAGIQAVVDRVTNPEVAQLLQAIYNVPAPQTPRDDLVQIFLSGISTKMGPIQADLNSQLLNADVNPSQFRLSEMLRLNLGTAITAQPNRLGVLAQDLQGYPNGRRLGDDVVDISLQAVAGAARTGQLVDALATGDKVDVNDQAFGNTFPYVALPNGVGVNTLNKGNGTGMVADPGVPGATASPAAMAPASATTDWMMPAAMSFGAAVAGVGGTLLFLLWWRRRGQHSPNRADEPTLVHANLHR